MYQNPYAQPQAPQGPYQPQQQPQQPYYPPQGGWQAPQYPQQAPQAPQGPPAPKGSLDDFYGQPSGGHGPSWSFKDRPIGTTYVGIVARKITDADVQANTNPATGQVQTYKDGRVKYVLKVPMFVQPDQTYPEGKAQWYVQGGAREELARAMAEAGAPEGPPEAGAVITVKLVGRRPVPGMNPANVVEVTYQRPQGAGPVDTGAVAQATTDQAGQQIPAEQPQQQANSTQVWNAVAPQQPVTGQPQAPAQQSAQVLAAPEGMPPEQAELLARLTGQAQQ